MGQTYWLVSNGWSPQTTVGCNDLFMRDRQAAHAVELGRALRDQLHCMTTRLARLDRQDVTSGKGRAVRREAAELRRDIKRRLSSISCSAASMV